MSDEGEALAAAAMRLVGAPFRLHGRDAATGLDCVGVALAALAAIGRPSAGLGGYRLRQVDAAPFLGAAAHAGLSEVAGAPEPGDLLLVRVGPAQRHIVIAGPDGAFVHAHAGLRRVVASPPPLPWPIERHWRLSNR